MKSKVWCKQFYYILLHCISFVKLWDVKLSGNRDRSLFVGSYWETGLSSRTYGEKDAAHRGAAVSCYGGIS